jgi:hypothetical protein
MTAQDILQAVVDHLPREPLEVQGGMIVRKRHGVIVREFQFDMLLRWGAIPPTARYTIRDAFGRELEQLTVLRAPGREPAFVYAAGSPLRNASLPNLFDPVQDTDISWADLTLSFLWWKPEATVTRDETRGRSCYVVAVAPPPRSETGGGHQAAAGDAAAREPYTRVMLWIDEKVPMVLQADGYGADGRHVRRLRVDSFKKIDERWMIKDMEVMGFPERHRTRLTVRDVNAESAP